MKVFFHFSVIGFSNTYLVGNEDGDAILIDPGHMDLQLLELIESNHYRLKHILLTHRHASHTAGIGTLLKIYDADIYSYSTFGSFDAQYHSIAHGDTLSLAGVEIKCLHVPGHSSDSVVFIIDQAMFTGDVLLSGRVGSTDSKLSHSLLIRSIREQLLTLDDRMIIFPGHGAPSTLKIEKMFNEDLIHERRVHSVEGTSVPL